MKINNNKLILTNNIKLNNNYYNNLKNVKI